MRRQDIDLERCPTRLEMTKNALRTARDRGVNPGIEWFVPKRIVCPNADFNFNGIPPTPLWISHHFKNCTVCSNAAKRYVQQPANQQRVQMLRLGKIGATSGILGISAGGQRFMQQT